MKTVPAWDMFGNFIETFRRTGGQVLLAVEMQTSRFLTRR
jgi:hypothetical protein